MKNVKWTVLEPTGSRTLGITEKIFIIRKAKLRAES